MVIEKRSTLPQPADIIAPTRKSIPPSATRRLLKFVILSHGYDLASKIMGYSSFATHLQHTGRFSAVISQMEHFGKNVIDVHPTTSAMIEALMIRRFVRRFKSRRSVKSLDMEVLDMEVLEQHNVSKKARKWGGVYRRIWNVKRRLDRKAKLIKIKQEDGVEL